MTARAEANEISTETILPNTGERFPNASWDLRFGGQYRQRFDNGWIGGVAAAIGSASDRPFHTMNETTFQATLFTRIPDGESNSWLLMVYYDNNREFLRNVPLPGVGYWYEPNSRFRAIVGLPFHLFGVQAGGVPFLRSGLFPGPFRSCRLSWYFRDSVTLRAAFAWDKDSYFRADRTDKNNRIFAYEKRLTASCLWRVHEQAALDLSAGYVFDRMLFEGENYSDRGFNRIGISEGPFLAGRLRVSF